MSYDQPIDRAIHNRDLIDDTVFAARRSGLVAYLPWFFLGGLGVHNFCLRRPKAGGLQMAGTLFIYCTYASDGVRPLIGLVAGIPLGISLFVDMLRIPAFALSCSERLRAGLEDGMNGTDD